jgi:hypothetical protein
MATSDGDVWLVEGITSLAGSPGSQIERRDATTGTLKATIAIPGQETVFAIAADGAGHIYVAGGGDGGVPRTTVSRVSTASDHLDYTAMLPSNATCSCPLAATADGVWLSGNGSTTAVVLDPASARVDAFVSLPAPSTVLSVVGSTIAIGLRDARVAIIDAATRQIVHVDAIGDNAVEPAGRVVAISPYRATSTTWNAWITRGDGLNLILRPNGTTIRAAFLGLAPDATATTASGEFLYFVATNALGARSSQDRVAGFANYDPLTNAFGFVVPSSGIASPPGGFDDVVSVGDSLWVKFGDSPGGTVLLVRPQ